MNDLKEDYGLYKIERYIPHNGTIKIAGHTLPKSAGRCAIHYLEQGNFPIDFMCIGANANQQATKAMGVFSHIVKTSESFKGMEVAFQPLMFTTETEDPLTKEKKDKSATVWRTVVFTPTQKI